MEITTNDFETIEWTIAVENEIQAAVKNNIIKCKSGIVFSYNNYPLEIENNAIQHKKHGIMVGNSQRGNVNANIIENLFVDADGEARCGVYMQYTRGETRVNLVGNRIAGSIYSVAIYPC